MPLISVSVAHGQSLDEAQRRLAAVVQEASDRFGIRRVEWSPDRRRVKLEGAGARIEMWVDPEVVHVTGDLPGLGGLLGGPVAAGLKQILERTFRKQLP
jgi:Putative polyhydroxyalkanoic acid system protein (PHA_gran_rgn)